MQHHVVRGVPWRVDRLESGALYLEGVAVFDVRVGEAGWQLWVGRVLAGVLEDCGARLKRWIEICGFIDLKAYLDV